MTSQIEFYQAHLEYQIDAWDLYKEINEGSKMVVLDVRSEESYGIEHIPGSLSFPHRTMTAESTSALDRSVLYVTYCDGIGCNASTKGAFKMAKLGFNVKELIGGIDWWKRDGYATSGMQAKSGKEIKCGC